MPRIPGVLSFTALILSALSCAVLPVHAQIAGVEPEPAASAARNIGISEVPDIDSYPELSLQTVILFALNNNPDLDMAAAREEQFGHSVDEARANLYPQANLNYEIGREFNDPSSGDDVENGQAAVVGPERFSMTVRQLIYDGKTSTEAVNQRKQVLQSTRIETQILREDIISQVIETYLNIYRLQQVLGANQEFIARMENIHEKIRASFEAGAASRSKFSYANGRLAFAKTDMQNAQAEYNDAISTLEFLTGKLPLFKAAPPEDLDPSVLDLDFYLEMAAKQNQDMILNESNIEAATHQLESEKGRYKPSVYLNFGISQNDNDGGEIGMERDVTSTVQVSYNLFDGFRRRATNKRIQAQISELEFKRRQIIKTLSRDIKQSYNQLTAVQESLRVTDEEIASNVDVRRLNYEKFELGDIDIIELIEGEERLVAARRRLYAYQSEMYMNTYLLMRQVGALHQGNFCDNC